MSRIATMFVFIFMYLLSFFQVVIGQSDDIQIQALEVASYYESGDFQSALNTLKGMESHEIESVEIRSAYWITSSFYHFLLHNESGRARRLIKKIDWWSAPNGQFSQSDMTILGLKMAASLLKPKKNEIDELMRLANQIGKPSVYLQCMMNRVRSYHAGVSGDIEDQRKLKTRAFNLLVEKSGSFHPESIILLRQLGNLSRSYGEFDQAQNYFVEEQKKYIQLYDSSHIGNGIANYHLGTICYETLEFKKAITHYEKALNNFMHNTVSDIRMSYLSEALGDMYFETGQFDNASRMWMMASEYRAIPTKDILDNQNEKALELISEGKSDAAFEIYDRALAFREESYGEDHPLTGACRTYYGNALLRGSRYMEAAQYYSRAIQGVYPEFDYDNWMRPPEIDSIKTFDKYIFESFYGMARSLFLLFKQDTSRTDYLDNAYEYVALANQTLRHYRSTPRSDASHGYWTGQARPFYEVAIDICNTHYQKTHSNEFLEYAFQLLEGSKSFLLKKRIQESNVMKFNGVSDSLVALETKIRSDIITYTSKIEREEKLCELANNSYLTAWREQLFKLKLKYDIVQSQLQENHTDYYHLIVEPQIATIDEIQEGLDSSHFVVSYFLGADRGFLFFISVDTIIFTDALMTGMIVSSLERFLNAVGNPEYFLDNHEGSRRIIKNDGRWLFNHLIGPVRAYITDNATVSILPDEQLYMLPFSSLLTDTIDAKTEFREWPFAVNNYHFVYRSVYSGYTRQKKVRDRTNEYLGMAPDYKLDNMKGDIALSTLKYNREEVEFGIEQFGGIGLFDRSATKSAFSKYAAGSSLLHLAVHAELNRESPLLSGIQLSGDSSNVLYFHEIFNMNLGSNLVILSGCETGMGQQHIGEGLASLGRAFQYAACPSVVITHWKVDDKSTSEIVKNYLSLLSEGVDIGTGLALAKRKFLKNSDPVHAHPYYWSGITLLGDPQTVIKVSNYRSVNTVFIIAISALVLISIFVYFRK